MPAADMSQKIMLGLWLSVILLGAGASEPEVIKGFLGEFVTFGVFPVWRKPFEVEPPEEIFWMKNGTDKFAWMRLSVPCNLQVHLPALLRRLSISENCRELILSNLEEEDAGIYTAKIVQGKKQPKYKTFDLKIFRRFLSSQLRVTCTPLGTQNREWRLNCSTENWVDRVLFMWDSDLKTTYGSETTITSQNLNLEVTCTAVIVGESASRTVTLKEVCAGASEPEVMNDIKGFLGESVSFELFPFFEMEPPEEIFWTKNGSGKFAWMRVSDPCNLQVHLPALLNRLSVSEDCTELILNNLEEEDAGIYTAKIVQGKKQPVYKTFDLKIFRHQLGSQLRVTCTPVGTRKREWRLKCSTENWVDVVQFRWESEDKSTIDSEITITSQNLNLEATCKADTRAESTSRTVTLKEVCAGQAKNLSRLPLWALLCLGLGGSLLLSGCMELIPMEKPRKAVGGRRLAQPHFGPTQENPKMALPPAPSFQMPMKILGSF